MKHLVIKNIGPLASVDISLNRINLIIGPQSTGRSCILKIASFCAWLEKSIGLGQLKEANVWNQIVEEHLIGFHNLEGYTSKESYFAYETDTMKFSYSFKDHSFVFEWKEGRWDYKRNKIAYIVAERNILSVVPNWYEMNFPNNSIRNFLKEWQNARNYSKGRTALPILNMGVKYDYDSQSGVDKIMLEDGTEMKLQNVSSGLQSLVPLFVLIDFITKGIFTLDMRSVKDIEGNITKYDHSDIYLEEPEENLFPETQHDLVNWLAELLNGERKHSLFIATHSPYIMSAFNNLVQAGDIIEESPGKEDDVRRIIGGNRAIKYDDVTAFAITDGTVHSIKDDELRLISPSELDTASDKISEVFNQLIQL